MFLTNVWSLDQMQKIFEMLKQPICIYLTYGMAGWKLINPEGLEKSDVSSKWS